MPKTFWLTGLSGSGKTTLSNLFETFDEKVVKMDGDIFRLFVTNDLGFTLEDRVENINRAIMISKFLNYSGYTVIASFITPTNNIRNMIKDSGLDYKLIYIKCDIKTCIERDVKGLYRRNTALMTGIYQKFDEPIDSDLIIETDKFDIDSCLDQLAEFIWSNFDD